MDISEIKKRRVDAENEILRILNRLDNETGLCPIEVNVHVLDVSLVEVSSYYLSSVSIKFQPI